MNDDAAQASGSRLSREVLRACVEISSDVLRVVAPSLVRRVLNAAGDMRRAGKISSHANGLEVAIVRDDESFLGLERSWDELHEACARRSPFMRHAWLYAWWQALGHDQRNRLFVVCVRAHSRLVGVAPFYVRPDTFGECVLRMLGDTFVGSEWLDVLVHPDHKERVVDAVRTCIATSPHVDGVELLDLDPEGSCAEIFTRDAAGLVEVTQHPCQTLPFVALPGSFDAYLNERSANMRYNVKRKEKKLLANQPKAQFSWVTDEREWPAALSRLFELHEARWRSKGQSGNFVDPRVRAFHLACGPALLRCGVLRLYTLCLSPGVVDAAMLCYREGSREFYLQAGIDPAAEHLAVGFCLMKKVVETCANDGLVEFDMLRGLEGYKAHWATGQRETVRIMFARPTLRGIAWLARRRAHEDFMKSVHHRLSPEHRAELKENLRSVRARLAGAGRLPT